jgi:hydroxypyruvate isomerase
MASVATRLPALAPTAAEPFKAKFAPHLNLLPTAPKGFVKQLQFAHDLGFRAWEENWLSRQKPKVQEEVAAFCKEKKIELGVTVISGGQGVRFYDPGKEGTEKVLADMRKGVELAKRTGQTNMTMIPGPCDPEKPREKQIEAAVDLMRRCCDVVEKQGIILALEPLSHGVRGGPPLLRSFADGHLLCKLVDRKSCKLLADFFHEAQIGHRNKLIENAEKVWDQVTYVQYGASPGRKEPGTGRCDYVKLTKWLRKKKYTGLIGMEHGASKKGKEGLEALLAAYRRIDA